jgi:hypothetical protein
MNQVKKKKTKKKLRKETIFRIDLIVILVIPRHLDSIAVLPSVLLSLGCIYYSGEVRGYSNKGGI